MQIAGCFRHDFWNLFTETYFDVMCSSENTDVTKTYWINLALENQFYVKVNSPDIRCRNTIDWSFAMGLRKALRIDIEQSRSVLLLLYNWV